VIGMYGDLVSKDERGFDFLNPGNPPLPISYESRDIRLPLVYGLSRRLGF